jgi:hypothetical protein
MTSPSPSAGGVAGWRACWSPYAVISSIAAWRAPTFIC